MVVSNFFRKARLGFIGLMILTISCVSGKKNRTASQSAWENLFVGTSTEKFRGYKTADFPNDSWAVENNTLKARTKVDNIDFITKDTYKNFELTFEWKTSKAGNSGVFFNVQEDQTLVSGNGNSPHWLRNYEMQLLDDINFYDKNPKRSTGALYDLMTPKDKVLKTVGEFNTARLIVNNQHVEHWINDLKVLEYQMDSEELKELVLKSKFKDVKDFARYQEGHIMFQHHGLVFWYKDIKIRRL